MAAVAIRSSARVLSGAATVVLTGVGLGVVALLWALEAGAVRDADWDGATDPDALPLWQE